MSERDYQHCMVLVEGSSCYVRERLPTLHGACSGEQLYVRGRQPTLRGACSGEQLLCQRETTDTAWCL